MNRNRQKVAIYVPTLGGGGAERVMATIASALANLGYDVDLLLMQKKGPYIDELASNVTIVNFNKRRMLFTLFSVVRYIREQRPDVILSAMSHTNIVTLAAAMVSFRSVRVVVSERGALLSSVAGKEVSPLHRLLIRLFYPRADAIVAVSQGVGRELQDYFGISSKLIRTIYNPVDIEKIHADIREVPQHPWLDGRHRVFIAVGRLSPVKDYENLLNAFSLVSSWTPLSRLIILGVGPSHESLLKLAQSLGIDASVDFVGFHSNPHSWLAASDVYVLSSRSEGLPNAMIQALACGVKVVSTDCKHGPAEILANGRWGTLVPVGDSNALAQAMSYALSDPSPQDVRSRVERFSIDAILDQFLDVLALETPSRE